MWQAQIKQRLPALIHPVRVARWLSYQYQYPGIAWRIQSAADGRVLAGPFRGVRIPAWQHRSYSELLGVYEHDLAPAIEDVIARKPRTIINVGAAYGYYALGFASRLPETHIIGYEMDITRVRLVKKFAALNGVADRIELRHTMATTASLGTDLEKDARSFILMDIEGGEAEVLATSLVPMLKRAELLIELHEMFVPGVTTMLQKRFAATHYQTLIRETPVPLEKLDLAAWGLGDIDRARLGEILDDLRGQEMAWLHLRPRPLN
jgi:hypothetical protein